MPTAQENLARFQEISRRGLQDKLPPDVRLRFDEAVNRGLIEKPFDIEAFNPAGEQPLAPPPGPEPTLGEELIGFGEAGLTAITGSTGGLLGGMLGAGQQIGREIVSGEFGTPEAAQRVFERSQELSQSLTNLPETELGQKRVKQLGELTEPLAALPPALAEAGAIGRGMRATVPAVRASKVAEGASKAIDSAADIVRRRFAKRKELAGIGAADVDIATQRRELAGELPVPIDLTEGQATRQFAQQRFERETAKMGDLGGPLRERFEDQNLKLQQNVDAFIDETGATAFDTREIGESVSKALRTKIAKDKSRIRALYRKAEKSGGMKADTDLRDLARYLNENRAEREESGIMTKVQRQLDAMEVSQGRFDDGTLNIRSMTLNDAEKLRRFINRNIRDADSNEIRIGSDLKRIIDKSTEGLGNKDYKAARKARKKLSDDFESTQLMKQLTGLKKGTQERAIALEDVLQRSVISRSVSRDSLHRLRRTLQNAGQDGEQAWKDIQGGTLQYIQDRMLDTTAVNQRGDTVVSFAKLKRAMGDLDNSNKLEVLYGKRGAEQLRMLVDVAQDVLTAPPGAVNHSNTATVLAGLMDVVFSGVSGVPAPILTAGNLLARRVKDNRLRAKVSEALKGAK